MSGKVITIRSLVEAIAIGLIGATFVSFMVYVLYAFLFWSIWPEDGGFLLFILRLTALFGFIVYTITYIKEQSDD